MVTGGRVQIVGGLLLLAGALAATRSPWPLIVAGVVLLVGPEIPGLVKIGRELVAARRARRQTAPVDDRTALARLAAAPETRDDAA